MTVTDRQAGSTGENVREQARVIAEQVKELVHQGNVRRIVVKNNAGKSVLEAPVTAGVIALLAAPVVTAGAAAAALASGWSIKFDRGEAPVVRRGHPESNEELR